MKKPSFLGSLFFACLFAATPFSLLAQGGSPDCNGASSATPLTSVVTCASSGYNGDMQAATNEGTATVTTCSGTTTITGDIWYRFTAISAKHIFTLNGLGTSLAAATTYVQVLTGTCPLPTPVAGGCRRVSDGPVTLTNLIVGTEYFVRVYTTASTTSGAGTTNRRFRICIQHSPDQCAENVRLQPGTSCTNTPGTLQGYTASSPAPASTCSGSGADAWFSFTATHRYPRIDLSSIGSAMGATTVGIQLFSGACGAFTPVDCINSTGTITTLSLNTHINLPTGLTIGTTYYVRIVTSAALPTGSNWTFDICVVNPPAADECAGATTLTPGTACTNTAGNLALYNPSRPVIASPCSGTPGADVWYSFVANNAYPTITLSSINTNLRAAGVSIQLFSGSCGSLTSLACTDTANSATFWMHTNAYRPAGLTVGQTYYIRIYTPATAPTGTLWDFNICVTNPAANDLCATATPLNNPSTTSTTCNNTAGNMAQYARSNPAIMPACGGNGADAWYTFTTPLTATASHHYPVITVGGVGTALRDSGYSIQLFSGTCGSLIQLDCITGKGSNSGSLALNTFNTHALAAPPANTTFYVRVASDAPPTAATTAWNYNICVTYPAAPTATPAVSVSRSYINISKGYDGGSIDTGDTLEIRTTFLLSANSSPVDNLSFYDTLYTGRGFRLVPNSIALRTNEGKVYKSFTDATGDDAGWATASLGNPLDTVVRINFGAAATALASGRMNTSSRPSLFLNGAIVMATYRVRVYAPYNTKINFGSGRITHRSLSSGITTNASFPNDSLIVYRSPGLCPNAVSVSNAVGAEFNGTFGADSTAAPINRNRGTSASTTYTYAPFGPVANAGPGDYYYAIPNNTSAIYSTVNTWNKVDPNNYRLYGHFDIIGDHTGATDPQRGNPACDTTRPISATNPCGYMLVINSAHKMDTAFQYYATNLCPNTYYEISAWVRNICYKCGADSLGRSFNNTNGYIPLAPGDSSGVQPNLAFDVNGTDYYTTGNIPYFGTTAYNPAATPQTSDSLNRWVKKGFVYLTGSGQTSFTLTIRNNAPGGGGNDWAMDDISIATCLPNMTYSPGNTVATCRDNPLYLTDTIRSYFNTYGNYKWQKSMDGGANWMDIPGQSGSETPQYINSRWEYVARFTVPPDSVQNDNNGDRYRVTVATTTTNLAETACQFTDGVSLIEVTVLSNCSVLPAKLLTFNGNLQGSDARLYWTTSRETERLRYSVERSTDGLRFTRIGLVNGYFANTEQNRYAFTDTAFPGGRIWYRIALIDAQNRTVYSRNIELTAEANVFALTRVVNPFYDDLLFDVTMSRDAKITATLYNASGTAVKQQAYTARKGTNGFTLPNLAAMPKGVYLLHVQQGAQVITKKVVK